LQRPPHRELFQLELMLEGNVWKGMYGRECMEGNVCRRQSPRTLPLILDFPTDQKRIDTSIPEGSNSSANICRKELDRPIPSIMMKPMNASSKHTRGKRSETNLFSRLLRSLFRVTHPVPSTEAGMSGSNNKRCFNCWTRCEASVHLWRVLDDLTS
jgi:hypothetical protein